MPQALVFTLDVAGDVQLRRRIDGLAANLEDFRPAFEQMADVWLEHMQQVFATEGMATAGHWPALSPAYAAWKAKHYPGTHLLVREGTLGLAMTSKGGPGNIREISATQMVLGGRRPTPNGNWDVGRLHQEGTRFIPRRRIINLPEWLKRQWMQILRQHLRSEA